MKEIAMADHLTPLVEAGVISTEVADAMRETKRITAEPCPVCRAGVGRWCDHRCTVAYGGARSILAEMGR
jgi:hypothetical protein